MLIKDLIMTYCDSLSVTAKAWDTRDQDNSISNIRSISAHDLTIQLKF